MPERLSLLIKLMKEDSNLLDKIYGTSLCELVSETIIDVPPNDKSPTETQTEQPKGLISRIFGVKLSSIKTTKKCTTTEKSAILNACERNIDKGIGMQYNYLMICLIAYSKGYTDPYSFSRLHLNDALWVCKFNVDDGQWSRSRYQFLSKTPFGLL